MRTLINFRREKLLKNTNTRLSQKGFSLIEIMVTVAIVGILASIAIPSYTDYIKKGKAAEATANLADLRVKMEQCFQDNRDYTLCAAFCAPTSGDKYFTYTCEVQTATTYTLQAAGKSAENMGDFNYTIDQDNAKTSTYDTTTGDCWLTSKAGTC